MHILIRALVCTSLCFVFASASAQDAEQSAVLRTVDAFFAALGSGDRAGLEAVTMPDSLNVSVSSNNLTIRNHAQLLDALSRPDRRAVERYWDEVVLVRGDIATFWAPYDFHIDGEYSHCGVDSFQLVKQDGRWVLSNLSWTIETESCAISPLGPLQSR